jgi:hypothetical protein
MLAFASNSPRRDAAIAYSLSIRLLDEAKTQIVIENKLKRPLQFSERP